MKNILRNTENSERLLNMVSDTLILVDKNGVCVDITSNKAKLRFLKESILLGKNLLKILPPQTRYELYPEFKKVLTQQVTSVHNYKLPLRGKTYFFKLIMQPYDELILCQYRDITERSHHKLELEKRYKELEEIQKAAYIGSWRYKSHTESFYFTGYTKVMSTGEEQTITVDNYRLHIYPDDQLKFQEWFNENLKGNMASLDYRIVFEKKTYYIRAKAFAREYTESGDLLLEGYIQNITNIHQRKHDIELLTHAINRSTEDIFAVSKNGTLLFANQKFRAHHNLSPTEDITTRKIYAINSYAQNEQKWKEIANAVTKEENQLYFTMYDPLPLHPEIKAYEAKAYWITDDEGIEALWGFGRDISKRISQEQQIKRFYQIIDKVMENLPAAIVVKDINNDFKYIYRNSESYNRHISMQEALEKNDFDFYPIEVAKEKRKQDQQVATTGEEMHWIIEEKDGNGETLFLDKRKIKIQSDDFSPVILSIEWDITDLEQMKRELIVAKEKAEASDQLKSAFLANMSHEIRTPLNAIIGFSRIIAESTDLEERKRFYDIVEANNERLLQLINEILDLSKIEAGIVEFSIDTVYLLPLCREIYDAHIFRCPPNVKLILEPSDPNVRIISDKNRVFQIISNLVSNAFKFTTHGNITFGYKQIGTNIHFYVKDTGAGIAPEKLDKVFERFVKANNFAQGTGLGLAICKTIVERLDGEISVSSKLGEGTCFTFTLPAERKSHKRSKSIAVSEKLKAYRDRPEINSTEESYPHFNEANAESPNDNKQKTILVVEDTESNYILVNAILGPIYQLTHAKDGMEAVTKFEEVKPDLVLMDMKMPNLDGVDATKIIRELSPETPIIALTAFAYEHDRSKTIEAGCNDFLTKPFLQEELKNIIVKWLS